ncbi:MAG: hypothetical protein VW230_02680 [Candidatus Poseidoniales archaeon]|jgi:hypothetical protein
MAAKRPVKGGQNKKKRRMKLTLKQSKLKTTGDAYTDGVGWSQDVGRTLEDQPTSSLEPETLRVQCTMCGSMMKIPKPKRSKYTVACAYAECGHVMKFD